jgi:hypothetical protein
LTAWWLTNSKYFLKKSEFAIPIYFLYKNINIIISLSYDFGPLFAKLDKTHQICSVINCGPEVMGSTPTSSTMQGKQMMRLSCAKGNELDVVDHNFSSHCSEGGTYYIFWSRKRRDDWIFIKLEQRV